MKHLLLLLLAVTCLACPSESATESKKNDEPRAAKSPTTTDQTRTSATSTKTPTAAVAPPTGAGWLVNRAADLDGDGTPEKIEVTSGTVKVGNVSAAYTASEDDLLNPNNIEVTIIDIDTNDKRREILVTAYRGEDDVEVFVYRFDGSKLLRSSIKTSNLQVPSGNGTLVDIDDNCGVTTTTIYRLVGDRLEKASARSVGKHDASECAG